MSKDGTRADARPRARALIVALITAAALLVLPASAWASSQVTKAGATITVVAAPGEANAIEANSEPLYNRFVVSDTAGVTAGAGCTQQTPTVVHCTLTGVTGLTVDAGDGDDTVKNLSASIPSTLQGGPGNDTLVGGAVADVLSGGAGNDFVDYFSRIASVTVTIGSGAADDGQLNEHDDVAADVEHVRGGYAADTLSAAGSATAVRIVGGEGGDTITGGAGDDTLIGGDNLIAGGDGGDTITGGLGADVIEGGGANDTLDARDGVADTIDCGYQVDKVRPDVGTDTYVSCEATLEVPSVVTSDGITVTATGATGALDDITATMAGADVLVTNVSGATAGTGCTQAGATAVRCPVAGVTKLTLDGRDRDDDLVNQTGLQATLNGGDGDDGLISGSGPDRLSGGAGADVVDYRSRTQPITAGLGGLGGADDGAAGEGDEILGDIETLLGGQGDDVLSVADGSGLGVAKLSGYVGADTLTGSNDAEILYGDEDGDTIFARGGDDRIDGSFGDDVIDGGAGDDDIDAGWENDTVVGGSGADFIYGNDGDDTIDALDGAADEVDCGFDDDSLTLDGALDTVTQCEATTGIATTVASNGVTVTVAAGAGAINSIVTTVDGTGAVVIRDPAGVTATGPCFTVLLTEARCPAGPIRLNIAAGDRDDRIENRTTLAATLDGGAGHDNLIGGTGADRFVGGAGYDVVDYGARTTAIRATAGLGGADDGAAAEGDEIPADVEALVTGSGDDVLQLAGVSTEPTPSQISAGAGDDLLIGSDDDEMLGGGDGIDTITGGAGEDSVGGGPGDDTIDMNDGIAENVACDAGDDVVTMDEDDLTTLCEVIHVPTLVSLAGATVHVTSPPLTMRNTIDVSIDEDTDEIVVTDANGVATPLADACTAVAPTEARCPNVGVAAVAIDAGPGNDRIANTTLLSGTLNGGNGDDLLFGGPGADTFAGGPGSDVVDYGDRAADLTIRAGNGLADDGEAGEGDEVGGDVERIAGGAGDDLIAGPPTITNVRIEGGPGDDSLVGGGGRDVLDGGPGADRFDGGPGGVDLFDVVDYSARTAPVIVTIGAGGANDGEAGEGDEVLGTVEIVYGGSGEDRITGDADHETLVGNGGDDSLDGGLGNDDLRGGPGNDALVARDELQDQLDCGDGTLDVATVDGEDWNIVNCETIDDGHPRAPEPREPAPTAPAPKPEVRAPLDTRAPAVKLKAPAVVASSRTLALRITCNEACSGVISLAATPKVRLGGKRFSLTGAGAATVTFRLSAKNRKLLRRVGKLKVKGLVTVVDRAGNQRRMTVSFTARR